MMMYSVSPCPLRFFPYPFLISPTSCGEFGWMGGEQGAYPGPAGMGPGNRASDRKVTGRRESGEAGSGENGPDFER